MNTQWKSKSLAFLWYILVSAGNISKHDKGTIPWLLRAFAWDVAQLHHNYYGKFPEWGKK